MPPERSPRLLVCADDLTGANDIGAQFARRGIPALVQIDPGQRALAQGLQVVVVNTESRHLPPDAAAERVRQWVELGRERGVEFFYKKTDSTLRGNIGAELAALAEAAEVPLLPFIPALPELGRTTRADVHYVHGQPLHESPFGRDPLNPMRTSNVAEIVRSQTGLPVHHLASPAELSAKHSGIVIFDAEDARDIDQIGAELARRGLLRACAGPAGFGMQLAGRLSFERTTPEPIHCRGPALVVNGSMNEHSLRQICHPATRDRLGRFQMPSEFLLAEANTTGPLLAGQVETALGTTPGNLLIYSVSSRDELPEFLARGKATNLEPGEVHHRVAQNTGRLVQALLGRDRFGTLVVFGGDTLMGIARANGWTRFTPLTEVMDGITVSRPEHDPLTIISKAGGFGSDDVLARILQFVEAGCSSARGLPVP